MPEAIAECMEAGADDYLTKPLEIKKLVEILDGFSEPEKELNGGVVHAFPAFKEKSTWHHINVTPLEELKLFATREGFIHELLGKFMSAGEKHLIGLENAAAENNCNSFQDIVHTLKGSAGTVGATSMYQICEELEQKQNLTAEGMVSSSVRLVSAFQESRKEFSQYLEQSTK